MVTAKQFIRTPRVFGWVDLAVVGLLAAFIYALVAVAREWSGPLQLTFSFYSSLKSVPPDLVAVARLARMSWWERFFRLDLSAWSHKFTDEETTAASGSWLWERIRRSRVWRAGSQSLRFFQRRASPPAVAPVTRTAAPGD